jgi:hypothetical protein
MDYTIRPTTLHGFWRDQSGAVTVDWTVLTGAVVGLGLTSAAAVRTGTGSLAADIQASLANASVAGLGLLGFQQVVSQSFSNGDTTGWSRGVITQFGEWGAMLGPFGGADTFNNPLTYDVVLPDGTNKAVIAFDLVIADSWDGQVGAGLDRLGEAIRLSVDGESVAFERFTQMGHGGYNTLTGDRQSTMTIGDSVYTVTMTQRDAPTASVGGWVRPDQRWAVQIEAVNPASNFQLGFAANLDQSQTDESFGIQNFGITAQ